MAGSGRGGPAAPVRPLFVKIANAGDIVGGRKTKNNSMQGISLAPFVPISWYM